MAVRATAVLQITLSRLVPPWCLPCPALLQRGGAPDVLRRARGARGPLAVRRLQRQAQALGRQLLRVPCGGLRREEGAVGGRQWMQLRQS